MLKGVCAVGPEDYSSEIAHKIVKLMRRFYRSKGLRYAMGGSIWQSGQAKRWKNEPLVFYRIRFTSLANRKFVVKASLKVEIAGKINAG